MSSPASTDAYSLVVIRFEDALATSLVGEPAVALAKYEKICAVAPLPTAPLTDLSATQDSDDGK